MRRTLTVLGCLMFVSAFVPAAAHAQQSLSIYAGGFVPKGEDSRTEGDVLVNNLDFFDFNLDDFKTFTLGGEWLIGYGDRSEFGVGIGISSETVPSSYRDLINENGLLIEQDLKLRIVPITASYRFLPAGRDGVVVPYLGIGLGMFAWRYSETGEFVDFDGFIFRDSFSDSGVSFGPVYLGGVRVPFGNWDLGGEIRYQSASGDLDNPEDFAGGTKIDLGGFSYLATFTLKF
jgi:hypothetical protein